MAEDNTSTNRRLKTYLVWLLSCFALVTLQKVFGWDSALIQFYLEKTTTATLVIIGGLTATDAVYTYSAGKNGGSK